MEEVIVSDLAIEEVGEEIVTNDVTWRTEAIKEVEVEIEIRVGQALMTVAELFSLNKGSIVELSNHLNQPVELLLNNKVIGEGVLVACGDNYGVEVTNVAE
ncbi:FliM/FliN family flagellar motor switch protein [Agarivorans sp. DSG3-1]|uniref:FliM/FliN family flagellar motor switch protein n=1 Tax=Agarivorans sp. DSG3-1 TaxID=3342249 RepID=UPI00398E3C91